MVGGVTVASSVQRNVWKTVQQATVEQALVTPTSTFSEITQTQYAQQRFLESVTGLSNPPFLLTSSHNRLIDNNSEIFRGYIRRSDVDPADATSRYRLYFMYNPATIQRNYIAYLNQAALDPGNALFGSGNMAAAPGIMDFTFSLLFDRHIETAQDADHPGTKVDYDYFDLVVRGVVPGGTGEGNAIPDNGIMMVNPNNITAVFGEDLTVHGRPYNASVSFEKFNHRMIPTRMSITIVMKAFYIGPVRTNYNFSTNVEEAVVQATIPYSKSTGTVQLLTNDFINAAQWMDTTLSSYQNVTNTTSSGSGTTQVTGTTSMQTFATNFLKALGVPGTDPNMQFILAWERAEGGISHNNPLNTTQSMPGATNFNSVGVKTYVSLDQAVEASVITITNGRYQNILDALKAGNSACACAAALAASPWGTGALVQKILGCGNVV